jgi:co-chaperonin GroES (HSP10)
MNRDEYINKHFPQVESGAAVCGNQILVQLRTVSKVSRGGIVLAQDTQDFNQGNTRVARIVQLGQIAFKSRESGQDWKEGAWAKIGDVVIMPAWGGFRFEVPVPDSQDTAIFATYNDYDVKLVVNDNFENFDRIL